MFGEQTLDFGILLQPSVCAQRRRRQRVSAKLERGSTHVTPDVSWPCRGMAGSQHQADEGWPRLANPGVPRDADGQVAPDLESPGQGPPGPPHFARIGPAADFL